MARARAQKRPPTVEELHFRSDNAFLCLLLNRRSKVIRVIDFRAGALPAKRLFIQSIAKREGVSKVFTLVEKDEVSSWTRVGFVREGTIPGFYKRSDGHLVGCLVGERGNTIEVSDESQKLAEKTINNAKKNLREVAQPPRGFAVKEVTEEVATAARDHVWSKKLGIGTFDSFGRGAERVYFEATSPKGKPNFLSAEFQDCFGHALVEILRSPTNEDEITATTAGLSHLSDTFLKPRGIISAFAMAPVDDAVLASVYVSVGFRKTGLLAGGLLVGDRRVDAILWTRKLANPAADGDLDF